MPDIMSSSPSEGKKDLATEINQRVERLEKKGALKGQYVKQYKKAPANKSTIRMLKAVESAWEMAEGMKKKGIITEKEAEDFKKDAMQHPEAVEKKLIEDYGKTVKAKGSSLAKKEEDDRRTDIAMADNMLKD